MLTVKVTVVSLLRGLNEEVCFRLWFGYVGRLRIE